MSLLKCFKVVVESHLCIILLCGSCSTCDGDGTITVLTEVH